MRFCGDGFHSREMCFLRHVILEGCLKIGQVQRLLGFKVQVVQGTIGIDVYLRPLIEELKELWAERIDTYDSLRKKSFVNHVIEVTLKDIEFQATLKDIC
ncbi:hypothetical protein C5167_050418 [Papaver somniferum]|uniref:Uncharacterized protein n=1 Tax=Papaver somniferum TaxID=3469 RepID=A0A4Y7KSK6_PAPSO|nr:hypothetical protein C5167_050418 [Papaver somniferum]